jgi:PKHD-type hydroxylase
MRYDNHLDRAIMPMPNAIFRTDISFTVFLSGPDEYDGGELVITSDGAEKSMRGAAGSMIAYSSGLLHRVNEVRSGCREVAVGWLQSLVANPEERQVLHDIQTAKKFMVDSEQNDSASLALNRAYVNLQRMWMKP